MARGSRGNGAALEQWGWTGADHQKFRIEPIGEGWYKIVAKHSGKVLEVTGGSGSTAHDALFRQADYTGTANQHFRPDPLTGNAW